MAIRVISSRTALSGIVVGLIFLTSFSMVWICSIKSEGSSLTAASALNSPLESGSPESRSITKASSISSRSSSLIYKISMVKARESELATYRFSPSYFI